MQELYRLGIVRSTISPLNFTVNTGMVSRVFYDEKGKITGHEVLDKFGKRLDIPHGELPSSESTPFGGSWHRDRAGSDSSAFCARSASPMGIWLNSKRR